MCGWEELSLVTDQTAVYSYSPARETTDYQADLSVHFDSNDTFCPITYYSLKQDDAADPANAVDTSEDAILEGNFTLNGDGTSMTLKPRYAGTRFQHEFFILAETATKFAYKDTLMAVGGDCDLSSNNLTLKSDSPAVITKNKNSGDTVTLLTKF